MTHTAEPLCAGYACRWGQSVTQAVEGLFPASKLRAKAIEVSEHAVIDEADQPIEFEQRVLQWRCGQKHLGVNVRQRLLEGPGNDVAGFVDVAQAMCFVEDDQVPVNVLDIVCLGLGELVGTDDRARGKEERILSILLADRVVALASRISPCRPNLSCNSWCHCLRRLAGTMMRILRRRSAQRCEITKPASMVLPRPTSSARSTPREGDCGMRRGPHRPDAD